MSSILLAVVVGAAFGAVLDRFGASNPNAIKRMLNLTDLRLAKSILLAIGSGSVLMFGGQILALVKVGHMSVKTAYAGEVWRARAGQSPITADFGPATVTLARPFLRQTAMPTFAPLNWSPSLPYLQGGGRHGTI